MAHFIHCTSCGEQYNEDAFEECPFCGFSPNGNNVICPNFFCGKEVGDKLDYCPFCHTQLIKPKKTAADIINEHKQKKDNLRETIRKNYNIEGDISEEEYTQLLTIYKEEKRNNPSSYQPPKTPKKKRKISKGVGIVIVLLALLGGFFIWKTHYEKEEKARIERMDQERIEQERRIEQKRKEQEQREQEQMEQERLEQERKRIAKEYSWMNGEWSLSSSIDDPYVGRIDVSLIMAINVTNRTIKIIDQSGYDGNYSGTFTIDESEHKIRWSEGNGYGGYILFDPYKERFYEEDRGRRDYFTKGSRQIGNTQSSYSSDYTFRSDQDVYSYLSSHRFTDGSFTISFGNGGTILYSNGNQISNAIVVRDYNSHSAILAYTSPYSRGTHIVKVDNTWGTLTDANGDIYYSR